VFEPKIRLDPELFARVKREAERAGYSSPAEFVIHLIERELARLEEPPDSEDVLRRLRGLGYIE
jgi:predicted DNA-binding protein